MSLCCVTYTDEWSAAHNSYLDLELGAKHKIVGSNSTTLGRKKPGDMVIITATKEGVRYFTVVELIVKLEECTLWADAGGLPWDHNFSYKPLTEIIKLTPEIKEVRDRLCLEVGLNPAMFMNSRFYSSKFLPVVNGLLLTLSGTI